LLDVYPHPKEGLTLWLLEDGPGQSRRCLRQAFPVSFYAAGPPARLRALWTFLHAQPVQATLARVERRDLFQPQPLPVLEVCVAQPVDQPRLFEQVAQAFPDLTYYDTDISLPLRYAAAFGAFPLAHLQVQVNESGWVQSLSPLDSPWDLDPLPAPLRVLSMQPDSDPRHAPPQSLHLSCEQSEYQLALAPARPLLANLLAILRRHDPDLLLTAWGDTWLLPLLLDLAEQQGFSLPLSRDPDYNVVRKREWSFFTYGQVMYRGQQVHLFGRWHVDAYNAMLFHDYGLDGLLESARVTGSPVQSAARLSPGSGISAMQVVTALRSQILVPWHKQQAEEPKSALDLMHADQGGLVYQPLVGLHQAVAEIDFISMYPGIMTRFNISPETVGRQVPYAEEVPALNLWVDRQTPGLVPRTLEPLLEKRIALKARLAELPAWDPRRKAYKARAAAHKWLLVTCFGYLGYKNARFGRIEAHESVTAYGREALLRAKEAAEDMGYTILHMYVDGLWVTRPGSTTVADLQPLLDEISLRTSLPISLEGIYRWLVFLPSRVDARLPVANRYFGAFQDGSLKLRGIESRRRDTPPFIVQAQLAMLEILAESPDAASLTSRLPQVAALLRRVLRDLRLGRIPPEALLVTQKLSRELEHYRSPSPAARAAAQLEQVGKHTRPGQHVRFIFMYGCPGVHAWDLPEAPDLRCVDVAVYRKLLLRAASTVLSPLGVSEQALHDWVGDSQAYASQPGGLVQEALPRPQASRAVPALVS
jgi:DNA polymerase-2